MRILVRRYLAQVTLRHPAPARRPNGPKRLPIIASTSTPPSEYALRALERFEGILGAEVTIHAIQIAQDERKQSWNYIKAILERYEREGVRSLADIQASEQQHQARQQQGWKKPAKAPVPEADRQPEDQAEFAARIAEQDAWMRDFLESQRKEEG